MASTPAPDVPTPTRWTLATADGAELSCRDYGDGDGGTDTGSSSGTAPGCFATASVTASATASGRTGADRPPILLLHGLAGHAAEWDALAALLPPGHRAVAYDARGHGASTRRPPSVTRAAHVADAAAVVRALGGGPAVLVGQSLGGHTAMLTAAAHPELVRALVLVEAGPAGPAPGLPGDIRGWLAGWPVPFPDRAAAAEFFGGGAAGRAWAAGLEEHPDGLRPAFDPEVLVDSLAENAARDFWDEWRRVTCPTLVVRGDRGTMPEREAVRMRELAPATVLCVVPGAAHDVHLDAPSQLRGAVTEFIAQAVLSRT
ncbi:alpha/beta fold hydrolase [Streptomyces sp. NPDC050504]|uniref:alpha/beta fold hydrolase n=1 Tax=Streptomyces sp. NPDC050504 TaxID=3365618 RepID=UPI0037BDB7FF